MKGPESYLKEQVKKHLNSLPRCFWHMPVLSGYGKQQLDFVVCIDGRFLSIETKAPGKKPTPRQEDCMRKIVAAGGIAFWCDSFDSYMVNMFGYGFAGKP